MATVDEEFVLYNVRQLVDHPNDVWVNRSIDEKGVLLELHVHPEDVGRVIGKGGATAFALRNLLRALGTRHNARYNLKVIDSNKENNVW